MAIALSKSADEVQQLPLVELAWEVLKTHREPLYFRDLMHEIQDLRNMSDEEAMEVIARLYTEINIDGRFLCIGQNVWGLKRWYPVDKASDKTQTGKRFVRRSSGDAFSDDDEDIDEDFEEDLSVEDDEGPLVSYDEDDADADDDSEDEMIVEEEEDSFDEDADDEDALEEEELLDEDASGDDEELDEDDEDVD